MEGEDELRLVSVGVDIGSSTSHLAFSRLVLERLDNRYVVVERDVFHSSDILLTPYADAGTSIDTDALGRFIAEQYLLAGVTVDEIDTGALILTGVAVRRRNARAIGELFADQAGQVCRRQRRGWVGGDVGGVWVGRGGAVDPLAGAGDEHRCWWWHLEDRGVRGRRDRGDHGAGYWRAGGECG